MENVVIIDSGIGGLTVFNHLLELNCNANVTYLADNRYFPYGTKNDIELIKIIDRILTFFINQNYQHIILACNTASVIYSKYLENQYPVNIYPIIDNTVQEVKNISECKNVGVIGTNMTIDSNIYQEKIRKLKDCHVTALRCSDLVVMCEEYDLTKIKAYIEKEFQVFNGIDTLILGCTHFNAIKDVLAEYFTKKVKIICSGYALIESLNNQILFNEHQGKENIIYVTSDKHQYNALLNKLFPKLTTINIKYLEI